VVGHKTIVPIILLVPY